MLSLKENVRKFLKDARKVVVLGVGSDLRGDDVLGVRVAEKLRAFQSSKLVILNGGTAPENFTGDIKKQKPSHLIIVDVAEIKDCVGAIKLLDPADIGGFSFSTHALPLKIMIDFIQHEIDCKVLIVAVQPKTLSFGAAVSPEVEAAAEEIVNALNGGGRI